MSYVSESFDETVVKLLSSGGVGLLPSDTIYGLSGSALDEPAVERLYKIKGRDSNKPFIILIPSLESLNKLSISKYQIRPVKKYWPGPLSVVFNTPLAPAWLHRGSHSLAIRLPNQPKLIQLMNKVGPLISTSANRQGQQPASSVAEAKAMFNGQLDFYVDVGVLNNPPSTLAELKAGQLKVIRPGAVKIE